MAAESIAIEDTMIGDTLTVTYNAVAYVLNRINQDNYSSEYMKKDATMEHRVLFQHARENGRGGVQMERHRVQYTRTELDTVNGNREFSSVLIIRAPVATDPVLLEKTAKAQIALMTDALVTKVVAWES
jgi:hypothetical protein